MNEKIKEAFDLIQADETLKNETKAYLEKKTQQTHSRYLFPFKKVMALAMMIIFAFLGVKEYQAYFTPVAYISVDINPSFELGINRYDKVVSVKGYNEDGKDILSNLNLKHMNYDQAIEVILTNQQIDDYLSSNEVMSLSLIDGDETIRTCLEKYASKHQNVYCQEGKRELVEEAHLQGFSFGKYQTYLELKELLPEISVEEVKEMSMREIHNLIASCDDKKENHSQGHHHQYGS